MSDLPKWIYSNKPGRDLYQRESDLQKAIEIMWEALEKISKPALGGKQQQWDARSAMILVEELGK